MNMFARFGGDLEEQHVIECVKYKKVPTNRFAFKKHCKGWEVAGAIALSQIFWFLIDLLKRRL